MAQQPSFSPENMMKMMSERRLRSFRELNQTAVKGATVCAGSSLMENFPINEQLMSRGIWKTVYNRGMSGFTIAQYDEVLDICVLDLAPAKLFINIGSNDLNLPGDTLGNLERGYRALLQRIHSALPACEITLLEYYPCMKVDPNEPVQEGRMPRTMENVNKANEVVRSLAGEMGFRSLNLNTPLLDAEGYLRSDIALDPIHFSAAGYELVLDQLAEYL